jgi:hypothetical protein
MAMRFVTFGAGSRASASRIAKVGSFVFLGTLSGVQKANTNNGNAKSTNVTVLTKMMVLS